MAVITGNKLTYKNGAWSGSTIPVVKTPDNWWTSNYPTEANVYRSFNMGLMDNIRNMPTSANTLGSDIADWVQLVNSPQYRTWQLQQRSGGAKNPGSVMDFINRFQNMSAGDAFALQWKMNPVGTTASLIGSGLDVANSIWSSFQNYRTAKQAMDLANKDYELKKQAYEANEARNQEKFDWLRQARATSQL